MSKQQIPFPKIAALIPDNEPITAEDITPEGVFLSSAHLNAVESALGQQTSGAEALAALQLQLDTANANLQSLNAELTTANTTITQRDATIAQQQSEIAELNKKPSGQGTVNPVAQDPKTDKIPSYLDANSPINAFADKQLQYMKTFKK